MPSMWIWSQGIKSELGGLPCMVHLFLVVLRSTAFNLPSVLQYIIFELYTVLIQKTCIFPLCSCQEHLHLLVARNFLSQIKMCILRSKYLTLLAHRHNWWLVDLYSMQFSKMQVLKSEREPCIHSIVKQ